MLYYADTMQAKAMKLMASKLAVASIIEGTFSDEGLAAMSDVRDMTSQMAKELALGIKDNVEDIAAAFKKMTFVNPNRENLAVVQNPPIAALPDLPKPVKVETSRVNWALYEGLLARAEQEQTKRKRRKELVNENQLTLFDTAA